MAKTLYGRLTSLLKAPRAKTFPLADFERFIIELRNAKIDLLDVPQFAKRYLAFQEKGKRQLSAAHRSFGLLKFDIHSNIDAALKMARILSKLEVPGTFLMMHRHSLNTDFFDSPKTWKALREIVRSGSEVGLHIDPFYLIRTYGNLYKGLEAELPRFKKEGLTIRTATSHGDTRAHIKARKLNANDFFVEEQRKTLWDGKTPEGEKNIPKHVGRYSYRKLALMYGITYFAEPSFLRKGKRLNNKPIAYISDNSHRIEIHKLRWQRLLAADETFRISSQFIHDVIPRLERQPFIALFHPQWYA